ncbi:diguanylate cyclase [Paraglaciecola sp.]|uniref:sensor domain-containing diguanylate cyclase n=1 Tax=Paraglaciecola sp. TaxID=1920173 RepID=UPI0030F406F0
MPHWYYTFRYRLTLLIGVLVIVLGIGFVSVIYNIASQKLTATSNEELNNVGRSTANMLAATLNERQREIVLLSKRHIFQSADTNLQPVRDAIDLMQDSYSHYAWIGFANNHGIVVAAGKGLLEGVDVTQRPWFTAGLTKPYLGDIHEAVLLAKKLPASNIDEPLRFVDFAAPVQKSTGELIGVVATHANWSWIAEVLASTMPQNAKQRGVEIFIVDKNNQVLYPFKSIGVVKIPEKSSTIVTQKPILWEDGTEYFSTQIAVNTMRETELGWRVIVRQRAEHALSTANSLLHTFLWLSLSGTIVSMLFAYKLASQFSKPVETLANIAKQIEQGNGLVNFNINNKLTEINSLAKSLQTMTSTLFNREYALGEINRTLEQKVLERTSALEIANDDLKQLARRDALTGLSNRLAMTEALRHEYLLYKRSGIRFALIILDVDHFKRVNDNHGHNTGDIVLKHIATLLNHSIRETDFVARFGGEEFIVLLPNTDDAAITVAEKIRSTIADSQFPVVKQITISLGVAIADPKDHSQDELIQRADVALYQAKNTGRNKVILAEL